jgi:hypothetical protein
MRLAYTNKSYRPKEVTRHDTRGTSTHSWFKTDHAIKASADQGSRLRPSSYDMICTISFHACSHDTSKYCRSVSYRCILANQNTHNIPSSFQAVVIQRFFMKRACLTRRFYPSLTNGYTRSDTVCNYEVLTAAVFMRYCTYSTMIGPFGVS